MYRTRRAGDICSRNCSCHPFPVLFSCMSRTFEFGSLHSSKYHLSYFPLICTWLKTVSIPYPCSAQYGITCSAVTPKPPSPKQQNRIPCHAYASACASVLFFPYPFNRFTFRIITQVVTVFYFHDIIKNDIYIVIRHASCLILRRNPVLRPV